MATYSEHHDYAPWTRRTRATANADPRAIAYEPMKPWNAPSENFVELAPAEPLPAGLPPEEEREHRKHIARSLEVNLPLLRAEMARPDLPAARREKLEHAVAEETRELEEARAWLKTHH